MSSSLFREDFLKNNIFRNKKSQNLFCKNLQNKYEKKEEHSEKIMQEMELFGTSTILNNKMSQRRQTNLSSHDYYNGRKTNLTQEYINETVGEGYSIETNPKTGRIGRVFLKKYFQTRQKNYFLHFIKFSVLKPIWINYTIFLMIKNYLY